MANFHEIFTGNHAILPVVHITDKVQAVRNAGIASEAGTDGIFLISMQGRDDAYIRSVHDVVQKEFPKLWIGVNYLNLMEEPIEVFANLKPNIGGAWLDDAGINHAGQDQPQALQIAQARKESGWNGLYFGGVAFKYRRIIPQGELSGIANAATKYMDVVTTSGEGTGSAPDVNKIALMKHGAGDHPLAIASGISPDNVYKYLNIADAFLVASSLLIPGTENFDPKRVSALVQAIRGNN
jgi:hypothetical protein